MQNDIQRQILGAMLLVLRPLARALLKAGIGYREFAEISKTAFVDVAGKDYGLRGRPTNISRVAVMTGLTRKEVRRVRDKMECGEEVEMAKLAPMSQVMHRWFTEKDYTAENGVPKILDFDSGEQSFAGLVKKYGGDIPPGAMRTELKRIGVVEELESGQLKPVSRSVVGLEDHEKLLRGLAHVVYPAALALNHNISATAGKDSWAHLSAFTKSIRQDDLSRIRRVCSDKASGLVESVDDVLAAYETLHDSKDTDGHAMAVGVGVFYFEDDSVEADVFK
jgi:hypothetical protein